MKILHVIHSVDPRSGGPSHAIRSLLSAQIAAGKDVSLLATTTQSAEPWEPRERYVEIMLADPSFFGAEVHLGRAYGRRHPLNRFAFSPDCNRWLHRTLSEANTRPDLVHIHGTFSHLTNSAARAARKFRVPYIVRPAGNLDPQCFRMGSHWLKQIFTQFTLRTDLCHAAFVHAMSEDEEQAILSWLPENRIHVIPHGIAIPEINDDNSRQELYARFPELRGKRVLLFLGRIAAIKRPEVAVRAMAQLRLDFPDSVLLIAGHDAGHLSETRDAVESCGLTDDIVFSGFLSGRLKQAALTVADVFVLPSIHENFGVAVVEAMAHGTPVVVTPEVATHVFVDNSGAGLTVPGNADAFAEAIARILSANPMEMGLRGRQYVEKHLTWPVVETELTSFYKMAIRQTRRHISPELNHD
ncbi:2-deoxystreptamine glucosyltransferase [Symmachiella macrocystis]|uniref:2-deoxystreptamine glucosyltransferase n=1 Tax=Symmachiella macrocystis TaxID=2527985 RepID=A0A5C6B4W3_9PLAN|nr:glycosyltransferase [Symmachiella macrocystis]TWU06968.1 2-deoxystreptamine glucosyltransferase [Symmachiella macrocystis]